MISFLLFGAVVHVEIVSLFDLISLVSISSGKVEGIKIWATNLLERLPYNSLTSGLA